MGFFTGVARDLIWLQLMLFVSQYNMSLNITSLQENQRDLQTKRIKVPANN